MDVDAVTGSIKQLVIGSGKFMQEANTFEQAEERIIHLEENDDQFHKYDLVMFLKSEIEECIGPIVDAEIERYTENGHENLSDTDTLVARITEKVTESQQFAAIKTDFGKAINESVERLVDNFEEEFRDVTKQESPPTTPKQRDPYQFSDEESTLSGSYNHARFMFVTREQLRKNIEHLDKKNNIQTRRAALNDLIHMSLNDVLTNDETYHKEWAQLERGVVDALCEQHDHLLPQLALKFISRSFASSQSGSRELYCTLTTFLYEFFSHKKPSLMVQNGLEASCPEMAVVLISMRLMNDFQTSIPNYWVRYPSRFLHDVLENTLGLVAMNGQADVGSLQSITPIHIMALLDPMAEWFMRWTHGCYSRLPLFETMKKHQTFLQGLVRSILLFVASRKTQFVNEASEIMLSQRVSPSTGQRQQRSAYSSDELEYIYFVHALNIVGRILMYKQGIKLFPLKIPGVDGDITITKLVCSISQLVTNPVGNASPMRNITAVYEPSILAADILKKLCSSESTYQMCLCQDEVTSTLLLPVAHWIDGAVPEKALASDATLLNVADILSMMASRSAGRRHLLYGERGETFARTSGVTMVIEVSSAAHCLTEFCKKSLGNSLPVGHGVVPRSVSGAYLFLCRQLYNNGEGLQAIYSYDIHKVLSQAWREASKATVNFNSSSLSRKEEEKLWWEELLKDNLLNFATTPKGVLLMQQSNAMQACVEYMCKRHQQRMQVSHLEKFGYGNIITQIAGTACGIIELEKKGLISLLCFEAWNSIEPAEESEVPFQPKLWPVDQIDKISHKPLMNLLHVFSNFTSVFELIGGEKLPAPGDYSFRDKPSSLIDLLDRVAIINTTTDVGKIHFLFNFEQSHVFGLRLLNVLICCLDTQLLLDSQFKFIETLLSSQTSDDLNSNAGPIVVDSLTVERNHILARAMVTGGPTERVLPLQSLNDNRETSVGFPLISSSKLPKEYVLNVTGKPTIKQDSVLSRYMTDTKSSKLDATWIDKCRSAFCTSLAGSSSDCIKGTLLQDVLEKAVSCLSTIKSECMFSAPSTDSESGSKSFKLTTLQELGVKKSIQYGAHLKLVNPTQDHIDNLIKLLRHAGFFLKQQQRQVGSNLRSLNHNYVGFDWFVATIFLINRGSYDKSWRFLQTFSTLTSSAYLWGPRMHRSIHLPASLASSGIPPVLFSACHNIELLLQVELPLVYPAFKMSGYTASQICQLWIRQCFWNFLDWSDICQYILLCVLMGVDYQVYICVAILKHLQQDILYHQQKQDLIIYLREHPIANFKVGEHLDYMRLLEAKYRKTILLDMLNLSKP